jgi:hypothetical protein
MMRTHAKYSPVALAVAALYEGTESSRRTLAL